MLRLKFFSDDIPQFFHGLVKDILGKRAKSGNTRKDFMQLLIQLKEKGTIAQDKDDISNDTAATGDYSKFFQILFIQQILYIAMGPFKGNATKKLSDGYVPFERTNSNMFIFIQILIHTNCCHRFFELILQG